VSASTQNQAKAALLFLYREVLGVELPRLDEVVQATVNKRRPVVLMPCAVRALMDELNGTMGAPCAVRWMRYWASSEARQ
jgi:hypothetical protein